MAVCFTGHRPNKLKGYDPKDNSELLWELNSQVEFLIRCGEKVFITGMALGIDTWAAKIVLKLKEKYPHIKLIAAVPCKNHAAKWSKEAQKEWQSILNKCNEVVYVSDQEYNLYCMQDRNEWMVDRSAVVIAVWDGTPGGTGNCVRYAKSKEKHIIYINPKDF